jgi:hypothetical protein
MERSKWQQEYDALPEWAQMMVTALQRSAGYGGGDDHIVKALTLNESDKYQSFHVVLHNDTADAWWEGFRGAHDLAEALTAPWPPPEAPARERRALNVVEVIADDDCAFDQPCAFGHRVEGHAVYCHNEAWPNSPRKCRRTWYTSGRVRDEDCPGYVANPDYVSGRSPIGQPREE